MRHLKQLIFLVSILMVHSVHAQKLVHDKVAGKSFDEISIGIIEGTITWSPAVKAEMSKSWETGSVPVVLEMSRMIRNAFTNELYQLMEEKTKQKFGIDDRKWQNWLWQQDYKPLARYPEFKAKLYSHIDERFLDYFKNDAKSTIRLDEVVWGGVRKDGIPPLRDPEMISVSKAKYLGDDDVVFGIEVDGEARAYPKRILAWHEMFTDTIQKVPLAGVY